jgi:hypothetical protein
MVIRRVSSHRRRADGSKKIFNKPAKENGRETRNNRKIT